MGLAVAGVLADPQLVVALGGDLGQVGDAQDLALRPQLAQ